MRQKNSTHKFILVHSTKATSSPTLYQYGFHYKKNHTNYSVLEPSKNQDHKLKHTISATLYFKKHYQEAYTTILLQKTKIRKENTLIADSRVQTRTLAAAALDNVEDGCCPFKIVFDEDFYVHFICILLCFKCVLGSA